MYTKNALPDQSSASAEFNAVTALAFFITAVHTTANWARYIVFPARSSLCSLSMYLASTIPAGHSCPPHPFFKSSCNFRGGERSSSKSMLETPAGLMTAGGTRSELMSKGLLSSLSDILVGSGRVHVFRRKE
jgi:hypothetical protein